MNRKLSALQLWLAVAALLGTTIFALSVHAAVNQSASSPSATVKPNLVVILADDLGYADVGFNGGKDIFTPHLDALAKAGTVLGSFYVQPVCSPTRASFMTGRYVTHTGVYHVVRPHAAWGLPLTERTLAEALRQAGYATAISGKWHLGEYRPEYLPTHRGFDHQYGHWFGALDYFTHKRDGVLDWHRDDQPCADQGYSTHLIAQEACRLIREQPSEKPLFLYVPFNAVHAPLEVPEKYLEPYTNLTGRRRTYAGMVAAMDEAVGQIIAALDQKGIRDNTLILFSSDNGGPAPGKVTSNVPLRAGKGTIYEGGVRVCAFANWPGHIPAGRRVEAPMHIVDWYPTLVKLAGGSLDQKLSLDGCDIWPVLTQGAPSPHEALLLPGMQPRQAAIRMGNFKLLQKPVQAKFELYNLADDIGETNNLAERLPEKVRQLKARLEEYLQSAVSSGEPNQVARPRQGKAKARRK